MEYKKIEEKRYLSVSETAQYLGVAVGTLYNRVSPKAKNPFPIRPKRIGKSVRFDRLELDRFMEDV
jgi:excisionase family DNA binding protein